MADSFFELKKSDYTGVSFANRITENDNINGILYEYLYNGGGLAAGDFNNDELPDLFFVSNQGENKLYLNKEELQFQDITKASGVFEAVKGFPTGATVADVNADGLLDIYLCRSGKYKDPRFRVNLLFINQGVSEDGIPYFKEEAEKYGLDLPHYSTQASFFDYDLDGDLDMFLINHGPQIYSDNLLLQLEQQISPLQSEQLYRNDNGFFKNVSEESGLVDNALSYGLGLAVGDINNDHWPDVIVAHDFSQKDHIYLNHRDGTFREISQKATNHISYFSMGNDIADFNNDGWLDFMSLDMVGTNSYDIKTSMSGMNPDRFYHLVENGFHHQYMFNCLQLNQGIHQGLPKFSDVAQLAGVSNTDWSWSPLFFDADNDGHQDLFVSNGIKRDFRNNDFLKYKQKRFDSFFGKYKENTRENKLRARQLTDELINRMPERPKANFLFRNSGNLKFEKVDWLGTEENVSNGAIYSDLDLDGDLDLVLNTMDQEACIYENRSAKKNFLQIKLRGSSGNLDGIGARVYVHVNNEIQMRELYPSRGFQSASLGPLHFGLGEITKIDSVVVVWPDGVRTIKKAVKANQLVEMNMDDAEKQSVMARYTAIELKAHRLPFKHAENEFNDFGREGLLPHRMSRFGPALAVGDIDGDGVDEIFAGGALGQPSVLLRMKNDSTYYVAQKFVNESAYEDVDAAFVDLDGDGDLDIYVLTGGNEYDLGSTELNDRVYINQGQTTFKLSKTIPIKGVSGGKLVPWDWDKDGDMDLLVTGRQIPGTYPSPASSYLLRNNSTEGEVLLQAENWGKEMGMVTDGTWIDLNNDGWDDVVVVGEWMAPMAFLNRNGTIDSEPTEIGLSNEKGWWFAIKSFDANQDGLKDLFIGNNGLNYKYKATYKAPFEVYAADFDNSGDTDIVLSYTDKGKKVPLRGRECSSQEMPFIKDSFNTYQQFATASIIDIYGKENLDASLTYSATNFASCLFLNDGKGSFIKKELPPEAQLSAINSIHVEDLNLDGISDVIVGGNFYAAEVETTRNDASYGTILMGTGDGDYLVQSPIDSRLYLDGDIRGIKPLRIGAEKNALAVARNNDYLTIILLQ